jgi:hypothetical protein
MSLPVDAVAVGTRSSAATIVVYGQGPFAQAAGALVGMRGHRVSMLRQTAVPVRKCEIWTDANAHYTTACAFHATAELSAVRNAEAVIVAVPATAYGEAFEDLCPHLSSGQTIFIFGAAFGAALEAERILSRRQDLSVFIVEISRPFAEVEQEQGCLRVIGARETLMLAGRSLNQTRNGLSVGGVLFNGVVPASTILERAFSDMDKWLDTATLLFAALGGGLSTAAMTGVLSALRAELQMLARAYGMHKVPEPSCNRPVKATANVIGQLADRVAEDFVILSSLARLKHTSVPILDAVIGLSGAAAGIDLYKEGRQLSDLGLIGMDAQEILEYISA